jgi:L-ascorbate metabolism protein UlaG (beta-lactamase superfamily)
MISVRWLGHATFEVECAGARFLIDPWMTGNPSSPPDLNSPKRYASEWKPTAILVTHAHNDHSADAVAISNASGAPVVSEYGWIGTLGLPEGKAMGGNVGGKFKFGSATVHLVPAIHSSPPGGRPMGFVIDFTGGDVVYHTGDTWIFGDMARSTNRQSSCSTPAAGRTRRIRRRLRSPSRNTSRPARSSRFTGAPFRRSRTRRRSGTRSPAIIVSRS